MQEFFHGQFVLFSPQAIWLQAILCATDSLYVLANRYNRLNNNMIQHKTVLPEGLIPGEC